MAVTDVGALAASLVDADIDELMTAASTVCVSLVVTVYLLSDCV